MEYGNIQNLTEDIRHELLASKSLALNSVSGRKNSNDSRQYTTFDLNNGWPAENTNNYWALLSLILVLGTATGNILVCLAIAWERRLQNVTNYFLMSLAITDLMVAILVMPLGILTLVKGYFPLRSEYCLLWICLDVLFCTASIMHLCTISVDRYLSLRYPMKFGRNKTRKRVTIKIAFVWLLSIAMSLPLSLMYSQNHARVLVDGTCQIPDSLYKLIGSIVCFYIPLCVMLLTYCLTVRLLAQQRQDLGDQQTAGWSVGWLGHVPLAERKHSWKKFLKTSLPSTPINPHSGGSTDTDFSTLDTHELWLPESSVPESTTSTLTALHQFGAEMLKLSRGIESLSDETSVPIIEQNVDLFSHQDNKISVKVNFPKRSKSFDCKLLMSDDKIIENISAATVRYEGAKTANRCHSDPFLTERNEKIMQQAKDFRRKGRNFLILPEAPTISRTFAPNITDVSVRYLPSLNGRIITKSIKGTPIRKRSLRNFSHVSSHLEVSDCTESLLSDGISKEPMQNRASYNKNSRSIVSRNPCIVTWDSCKSTKQGSNLPAVKTALLPTQAHQLPKTTILKHHSSINIRTGFESSKHECPLQRSTTLRSHHSRNSSVLSRNSSRHGRIIRLEQKATKVLGVVFFTFIILWAPFFILNLIPTICGKCEERIPYWVFDIVTWLGYSSSMVNPIFYTIFNKVFRETFKKVLLCKYKKRPNWPKNR